MPAATSPTHGPPRWETPPMSFGAWRVTRYEDVRAALADNRLTRDDQRAADARAAVGLPTRPVTNIARGSVVLECDPPKHTALRKIVNPEFSNRRISQLRPEMEKTTRELVNQFCEKGEAELTEQFALPLTVAALCEFTGIPHKDWELFHPWVQSVHFIDATPEGFRKIAENTIAMDQYFDDLITAQREQQAKGAQPSDDVIGRLIASEQETGLSHNDLIAMCRGLLVGGYGTSKGFIVTAMLGLLTHPEQLKLLLEDPERTPLALEEALRYEPPFAHMRDRHALEDLELGGVTISQGEAVLLDARAANRDPERFRHAEELDITDVDRGHVAFGPGTHHCLGAAFARLEADIAVRALLTRLPDITLACAPEELDWPAGIVTAPATLPVRFEPSTVQ